MSDSLQPHGPQHARPPCPSPAPRVYPYPCPWSRWCHPAISSSVIPFSSCLQSFPTSGCFLMSLFIASGDQRLGVSASASVLPMNIQDWFSLGGTGWISLQFKGLSRVFSNVYRVRKFVISFKILAITRTTVLVSSMSGKEERAMHGLRVFSDEVKGYSSHRLLSCKEDRARWGRRGWRTLCWCPPHFREAGVLLRFS